MLEDVSKRLKSSSLIVRTIPRRIFNSQWSDDERLKKRKKRDLEDLIAQLLIQDEKVAVPGHDFQQLNFDVGALG